MERYFDVFCIHIEDSIHKAWIRNGNCQKSYGRIENIFLFLISGGVDFVFNAAYLVTYSLPISGMSKKPSVYTRSAKAISDS